MSQDKNSSQNGDSFKLDGGLIVDFLMLFIPGLRFIGAIWLYTRLKKQFKLKKWNQAWSLGLTLVFIFYALTEFGGGGYPDGRYVK